jgi:hypothetical protein
MFKNWQWRVTDFGIEAIRGAQSDGIEGTTPNYEIDAKRLIEKGERDGEELYAWPIHMAAKTWVSVDAFIEAFKAALKEHAQNYEGDVDSDMLERSIEAARHEKGAIGHAVGDSVLRRYRPPEIWDGSQQPQQGHCT